MIVAMAHNRIIGADNDMPWHLPADLQHFRRTTMGKPVVMGRKTYESIGKALPGRHNIVITTNTDYTLADASVVYSVDEALSLCAQEDEVMIIGGGSIYALLIEHTDTLHLTFIDKDVSGDTQFPDWTAYGEWQEISREAHQSDDKNPHDYEFVTLIRR
ncbi:MAG: type 3 dihydrofolate reductase [Glaciecola sp.]|nr:type 3 dihydrofolate reductase [Glaciecola sp.]MDG1815367.1 type 3 dihydrofolate reductase [Glaciecola sp.]MDG2099978.1 type 3 dihydrofolate reductase [Glaciecola sp.]